MNDNIVNKNRGVTIGDYVKIGANSVVLEDIPSYSTVVGIKAKIVKGVSNENVA